MAGKSGKNFRAKNRWLAPVFPWLAPVFPCFSVLSGIERVTQSRSVDLTQLLADVDKSFEEFAPVLKIQVPEKFLSDWLSESPASV